MSSSSSSRSQLGQLRHPGMTSTDGTSPKISRWKVAIRANLIQPLGFWVTRRTLPTSKYDLEAVHERCRSGAEELDVPGYRSQITT